MKNIDVAIYLETRLNAYAAHKEDFEEIKKHLEKDIELKCDEYGRIWNEANQYIADVKFYKDDEFLRV